MIIYVDMDEVICDFTGGVCDLYGINRKTLETFRSLGTWSIVEALDSLFGRTDDRYTREEMISVINDLGNGFWRNLNPLPDCDKILSLITELGHDWFILTKPFPTVDCFQGKIEWYKRNIDSDFTRRLIITEHKYLFSKPGTVLIDDSISNTSAFLGTQSPGKSILLPHQGNHRYELASKSFEILKQELTEIVKEN